MHSFYETKDNTYWTNRIASSSGSPIGYGDLCHLFSRDMVPLKSRRLRVNAEGLAKFFIDAVTENAPPSSYSSFSGPQLNNFDDLNIDDVRKIILGSPIKTCRLTWIRYRNPFYVR